MAAGDWKDRVKTVASKSRDSVANLSEKTQNLVNGHVRKDDLDMHKDNKMRYTVRDSTYRDVYSRGSENTNKSQVFVKVLPWATVGLLQFLFLFLIPVVIVMVAPKGTSNYFKAFFFMYVMPISGTIRGLFALGITFGAYNGVQLFAKRYWESQHVDESTEMLNQYPDDSRLQQPEELAENMDIFPDVGMHSRGTDVTAIVGHIMLNNQGLDPIDVTQRADGKYDKDDEGQLINKNVPYYDDNEELVKESKPVIDIDFGEKLWDSDDMPRPGGKNAGYIRQVLRHRYSPKDLMYNPTHLYGKADVETVADRINQDWYMPDYEVQRPAGAYVVDTQPNNTMVLAMTRAGKGQTVIEPTIDAWLRSDIQSNIVCNDPKGELYLKFYYMARKRGYKVVSFNLMEPSRTDIYNPLGYAIESARQGNNQEVEEYVKTIGDVFFPPDKSDDPMWPNAANAAFQRSALGLVDYYMEEDRELHQRARDGHWSINQLDRALDESWGHVTLYNVYQMMTQLASKKSKDAAFIHLEQDDPSDEKDYLTLFFDATAKLPRNALRTSVQNQDNSLRAMAKSDKTIASVYGISLTAIKFFADDRISRLTSGRPSQNFDIVGMSFPRRFDIKLDTKYIRDEGLRGQAYKWTVYRDPKFSDKLPKVFDYSNNIDPSGWMMYVTKGIFPQETVYLKLEISEQATGLSIHSWYFQFTKGYQRSLDGRTYVIDPVSDSRVVKDGHLIEVKPVRVTQKTASGKIVGHRIKIKRQDSILSRERTSLLEASGNRPAEVGKKIQYNALLFEQVLVHYGEEPSFVDFITPPHLKRDSRIVLILINQMFNMQVNRSYLTFASQKPLYNTKYMLDEVGNLSSDGSGIPDLQTKESIGLGQGQLFTLILQTLQQLKDVYGDSIDKILQGNTGNIIYLKSTDDSMLQILEDLSGKRHRLEHDQNTTTEDMYKVFNRTDGKLSKSTSAKEVPVISKNDMLRVTKGNSIVFGHGNPIWNRNQLNMPYSFMSIHANALKDFEDPKEYTLRTVPTTANTMDFDILNNQPNFIAMVSKRVVQARMTERKLALYKQNHLSKGHTLTDDDLSKIDPEALSKELMQSINDQIAFNNQASTDTQNSVGNIDPNDLKTPDQVKQDDEMAAGNTEKAKDVVTVENGLRNTAEENTAVHEAQNEQQAEIDAVAEDIYADKQLSKHDLTYDVTDDTRNVLAAAYAHLLDDFKADKLFTVDEHNNLLMDGTLMIKNNDDVLSSAQDDFGAGSSDLSALSADGSSSSDEGLNFEVQDAWLTYLASLNSWQTILNGEFDSTVATLYREQ